VAIATGHDGVDQIPRFTRSDCALAVFISVAPNASASNPTRIIQSPNPESSIYRARP
jgi:hypothetical protein